MIFPNEIKGEIAKHLSIGTLKSLCCVSKDLNKVRFSTTLVSSIGSTIMRYEVVDDNVVPWKHYLPPTSCPNVEH